jgi:phospholipase C
VSHRVYDHTSILRFIETRFGLPALTDRDANADPLLDLFDFSQARLLHPPALPVASIDADRQQQCTLEFRGG